MAYAENFTWLRMGFVRIQSAQRAVGKLPWSNERRRVLEHLDAAERALNALDRDLAEAEDVASYGQIAANAEEF
jgi:hypothetical protein